MSIKNKGGWSRMPILPQNLRQLLLGEAARRRIINNGILFVFELEVQQAECKPD
jgi:hypothetical protein